jgi:uncharacterized cupredoxin-like copper-binding protein
MHDGWNALNRAGAIAAGVLLIWSGAILPLAVTMPFPAFGHEDHGRFSAGRPGDPKMPARVVKIRMFEGGGKMGFEPAQIEVRRGEQVRFVLHNDGEEDHEFILATVAENRQHAEIMKKNPDMEHDEPNGRRIPPHGSGEIVWRFTKRGKFEFACLILGHYDKGMFGQIIVK